MGKASQRNSPKQGMTLSSLLSNKCLQLLLVLCAISFVYLFYTFATTKEDFFTKSKQIYESEKESVKQHANMKVDRKDNVEETIQEKQQKVAKEQADKHSQEFHKDYHTLFIFTKVKSNPKLKEKFSTVFGSLFEHAVFDADETFHVHFVCDEDGREFAEEYLKTHVSHPNFAFKVHFHSSASVSKEVFPQVQAIQTMLGQKHPYYEDTIFFISLVLHKVMPDTVHRLVQLDLDLKFTVNIRDLWKEFAYFKQDSVIGLAHENQPVYRHLLWKYRQDNLDTTVGNPPATGNPGFNSGVILLHLDRIRASYLYNSYLDVNKLQPIVQKYAFKGHLGDQDFYSLLSFESPELFHVLDCSWNRQLCQWWKNKGYEEIFDQYFHCDGSIKIWHGNCDSTIPV